MLISLLLFKGVAAAAMLCCGPDHSEHSSVQSKPSAMAHNMMSEHGHHNAELPAQASDMPEHQSCDHHQIMSDHSVPQLVNDHQSSCSGCAVSCSAAVMMINTSDFIPAPPQNERIFSLTPLVFSQTSSGLERPPRLFS